MRRTFGSVLRLAFFVLVAVNAGFQGQVRNGNSQAQAAHAASAPIKITLPLKKGSVRFAVIGDTGTGTSQQHELGDVLLNSRQGFPYEFVLMLGDNLYGGETPADYKNKFQDVYQQLLDGKVKFYAALGNHDAPAQRFYENFNMDGKEYYRFTRGNTSFYALNSNYMDKKQVDWLENELAKDTSEWKIAFCHHPPYSSGGKHGSDEQLRKVVEPIFVKHGVNVVLAGHEHFYERIKPQKGIFYFISGAGGKLRSGDVKNNSPLTAKAFDTDMSFMLVEIADDAMYFQVLSRKGETVDSGVLPNQRQKK
jgi:3',5'-cyclic AMP phosphodiesterase CpdA